jgi:hypothetical protein
MVLADYLWSLVIPFTARDAMVTAQGGDSFACPSIASAREMAISIQDACDDVVG